MKTMQHLYRGKKILITGGAGFIGSHLAEQCHQLEADVTILDNFATGTYDNIISIASSIKCIEGDITHLETCIQAAQEQDIIFHLAAYTSVAGSIENPHTCSRTNVMGTLNILEAARIASTKKFIFASSAAVYGNHEGVCHETTPCAPLSPYGYSKHLGELLCQQFAKISAINIVCLRYFNVYGPRQRGDLPHAGVLAHAAYCMEYQKPFTIYGDGMQQRDFIHVDDVVSANMLFGAYLSAHGAGEVYNIASGNSVSLMTMISKLRTRFPLYPTSHIIFAPSRTGDIRYSAADCSKYRTFFKAITEISH